VPPIDPASLVLTNALLSFAMAALLLISRLSLGDEGRGVRTWVLADIMLSLARIVAAGTISGLFLDGDRHFPLLPGMLAALGVAWHVQAIRRVAGHEAGATTVLMQAAGLALLFGVPAAMSDSLTLRMRLFDAMLGCSAAVTLWALRPLMHFWGARLIALMMVVALVYQSARFGSVLLGMGHELPDAAIDHLQQAVRPGTLVLDLVISLFVTGGFVLLLQERLRARIERLVVTDALTGALNRRGLMPLLDRSLAQAQRHQRPMSLVLFDLDHFKRVNDQHGHATGDAVLSGFAARIASQLRAADALARWGGEEFLLLLPDTALEDARTLAERLRQSVASGPLAPGAPPVTVSGGIVSTQQMASTRDAAQALLALLDEADKRLYRAKRQRNCMAAGDEAPAAGEAPASAAAAHAHA
jgi:diguanylate cyclase (GGDEF)-like protein